MTPNAILKKTRREREMTLGDMADVLGASNQRISQWESGQPILLEHIRKWLDDKSLPAWAREMAYQMWLATIQQEQERLRTRILELASVTQSMGVVGL